MPVDRARYPASWESISKRIREEAGNRCEWCGVANGAVGARDYRGEWHNEEEIDSMNSSLADSIFSRGYPQMIRIVLTVAHLGTVHADGTPGDEHDKHDVRRENLAALCQRCHLNEDRADHLLHAAETRQRKRKAARAAHLAAIGQVELPL